jgi:hypothetical protein
MTPAAGGSGAALSGQISLLTEKGHSRLKPNRLNMAGLSRNAQPFSTPREAQPRGTPPSGSVVGCLSGTSPVIL